MAVAAFIFANSHQTAEQSSAISHTFSDKIFLLFVPNYSKLSLQAQSDFVSAMQFAVRKGAHFSIYALLSMCVFSALQTYNIKKHKKVILCFIITTVYAASDELHQLFISGRSGQFSDVCIDSLGAGFGIAVCLLLSTFLRFLKKRKTK